MTLAKSGAAGKKGEVLHRKATQQRDLSYYLGLSVTHRDTHCGWTRTSRGFIQDVLVVGEDISDVMFTCYFDRCKWSWEIPEDVSEGQRKDWTKWKDLYKPDDWAGKSISGLREDFFIDHGSELRRQIIKNKEPKPRQWVKK
jgi:hypothetical protein